MLKFIRLKKIFPQEGENPYVFIKINKIVSIEQETVGGTVCTSISVESGQVYDVEEHLSSILCYIEKLIEIYGSESE